MSRVKGVFSKKNRLAVAQTPVSDAGVVRSLVEHAKLVRNAKQLGAKVIVFPELSLTGASLAGAAQGALELDSPIFELLAEQSKDVEIIIGFTERNLGKLYNSAAVFQRGTLKCLHRKVNLVRYEPWCEDKVFTSGRETTVYESICSMRTGLLICNDFWNPGIVHAVASANIDVLIVPASSVEGGLGDGLDNQETWIRMLKMYASIYGIYIVFANCVGENSIGRYWGGSFIIDPLGQTISNGSSIIIGDLDSVQVERAKNRHPMLSDNPVKFLRDQFASHWNRKQNEL